MNTPTPVVEIQSLQFGYHPQQAILKDLHLQVPKGAIYGFLGANGAGKSTTIRNILGLLRSQNGQIKLFGEDAANNRQKVLQRIGCLIESPSLYQHLNAVDNLQIYCRYWGIRKSRVSEVLDLVGLTKHRKKATKHYSTGMKQRLGLAIALLSDPDLLILDEPTNGLDPTGIIEIRNILKSLNEQGKTIFLSSHLLSEIEKIATQVGILKNGKMAFEGSIQELEQARQHQLSIQLTTPDIEAAASLLSPHYKLRPSGTEHLHIQLEQRDQIPGIIEQLSQAKVRLYGIHSNKQDLEQLFIHLTTEV